MLSPFSCPALLHSHTSWPGAKGLRDQASGSAFHTLPLQVAHKSLGERRSPAKAPNSDVLHGVLLMARRWARDCGAPRSVLEGNSLAGTSRWRSLGRVGERLSKSRC